MPEGWGLEFILRQAGSNWVTRDRFFDRETDLQALERRVRAGAHTLLTAQRRMGKTSLVRELFRRFEDGEFLTVFVDLEAAVKPEDAIAEIGTQCRRIDGMWGRVRRAFGGLAATVDEIGVADLRIKLRSAVDASNWSHRGEELFTILAASPKPTVLAIDELPMIVTAMLKGYESKITPERIGATRAFLGWLRKNGQAHRDRVTMIVSGSVGLQPILQEAGLSAYANIFSPLELRPWTDDVARACLDELANTDGISLPSSVKREICRRLRCCVPHHVQQFYFYLHELLKREGRHEADMKDVTQVYQDEMLGMSGQVDLNHYDTRLNRVLGPRLYWVASALLTHACTHDGFLRDESVKQCVSSLPGLHFDSANRVRNVLRVLEHDGYLARGDGGYRFVSGLLEDWWRKSHAGGFDSFLGRPSLER